jgi:hypothetical protein
MQDRTWSSHEIIEIIIDGNKSDPITPLTPAEKEHLARVRERLIKQGLMKAPAQTTQESSTELK